MDSQDAKTYTSEFQSFGKLWLLAITSLFYCYFVVSRIPSGLTRLLSVLPIIYLFIILPLGLSSFHLAAPTIFYLVWLGNFKLLLFSFNQGPLSFNHQRRPPTLLHFISTALLPIKTKTDPDPSPTTSKNSERQLSPSPNPADNPNTINSQIPDIRIFNATRFAIKVALLVMIIGIYSHRENLHQSLILALYCCHVYLGVELVLAVTAVPVRVILGLEIEPQFNEPYLATSLQDFWGRRWNLMVTSILRPTVYNPVRIIFTPIFGRNLALATAIWATFLVSGLMHEIIYYYMSRVSPTWEVTWFFVLHGICVAAEIALKKALRKTTHWRLHRAVSGPLTLGFVGVTGAWLFFPQLLRYGLDLKAINEYYVLLRFAKEKLGLGALT